MISVFKTKPNTVRKMRHNQNRCINYLFVMWNINFVLKLPAIFSYFLFFIVCFDLFLSLQNYQLIYIMT